MDYKTYLAKIVALTKRVSKPETQSSYPASINSPARRALYDNLKDRAVHESPAAYRGYPPEDVTVQLAIDVDAAIRNVKKAGWRDTKFKKKEVRIAIKSVLGDDDGLVDAIFEIVKNQRDY